MAWIYLAEPGVSASHSENGSKPSHTVKTIDTARACFCHECRWTTLTEGRFGTMCGHLENPISLIMTSTLFLAASRARTSALQDMDEVWMASEADFTLKSSDYSKKRKHGGYFSKTSQPYALKDYGESYGDLPIWGMTVGGLVYQPKKLEPTTYARDGSYWPTPVANDDNKSPRAHMAMKKRMRGGPRKKCTSLNVMVKGVEMKMWPTPNASDWKGASTRSKGRERPKCDDDLPTRISRKLSGQLSPTWVEWLMGYHLGWTELKPWATQWFHSRPKRRSKG